MAIVASLVGCGSDPETPPVYAGTTSSSSTGSSANPGRDAYVSSVHPELQAGNCTTCHAAGTNGAPVYLAADAGASYDLITKAANLYQPAGNSQLWQHGAHTGPALSAEGVIAVKQWLAVEFPGQDPGSTSTSSGGSTGGGLTLEERLDEFSACMSRDEWEDFGMGEFPNTFTVENRACKSCHSDGNAGTFLNDDLDLTFDANRQAPYRNRLVTPDYQDGEFVGLKPNDRMIIKGSVACDADDFCHDNFVVAQSERTALISFQNTTLAKLDRDGRCNP